MGPYSLHTPIEHATKGSPLIDSSHSFASFFQRDDTAASFRACRIHGHLYVNKVAGNFHITVGKYVTSLLGYSVVSLHSIPIGVTLILLLSRSIPHPRGHAHLAALVSHDCKFTTNYDKPSDFPHRCRFVSQLITSPTESTTSPLEKTFLGSSALWMAQRKSLLIVRLCCPSLLFTDVTFFASSVF